MLYCIGANELTEHADTLAGAIVDRLRIFSESNDSVQLTIALYPGERNTWVSVNPKLSDELFKVFDRGVSDGLYEIIAFRQEDADDLAGNYDAYYGSPSPLVPAFATKKKPVMIANYDV